MDTSSTLAAPHDPLAPHVHSPGFLKAVAAIRGRVREIPAAELPARLAATPGARLLDVREDHEWHAGHIEGAEHLGRGILERDIETLVPDLATPLFLYCGGGYRSALATEALDRMGYTQVTSIDGGYKALVGVLPVVGQHPGTGRALPPAAMPPISTEPS